MKPTTPVPAPSAPADAPQSMLLFLRRIVTGYARRMQSWGLPLHAASTLIGIDLNPDDAEPALLADSACVPRQTMTTILDALEQRGLVVRETHSADRRRKLIRITPAGKKLARDIRADILATEAHAMNVASPGQLPIIRDLLSRYTDAIEAYNLTTPPVVPSKPAHRSRP